MNKSVLRVIISPHEPWFYQSNDTDCNGILCELLKYVCSSLNLSYNSTIKPIINGTGYDEQTKEYKGLFGIFQRNV